MRMLPMAEVECATLIRQIYSQRQLYELMVDFWHDHFSVFGWDYDGGPMFVAMDRDAIRPNVFGNFRTMLQAVGESASMMYMLDLYASQAGHPNENYARELMELHTLGAENYAGIVRDPGQLRRTWSCSAISPRGTAPKSASSTSTTTSTKPRAR